ncbi:hypothetical protein TNCT_9811 [Trichonephila clavata]|uniref:Uncharacterized protein n=1 Tax=Trichonephila clavata TaxID=2740835 RepID=A0A8X6F733_TRICU|nr:hypothetical protein TNCT_9811 [Trichonephila clavata]
MEVLCRVSGPRKQTYQGGDGHNYDIIFFISNLLLGPELSFVWMEVLCRVSGPRKQTYQGGDGHNYDIYIFYIESFVGAGVVFVWMEVLCRVSGPRKQTYQGGDGHNYDIYIFLYRIFCWGRSCLLCGWRSCVVYPALENKRIREEMGITTISIFFNIESFVGAGVVFCVDGGPVSCIRP